MVLDEAGRKSLIKSIEKYIEVEISQATSKQGALQVCLSDELVRVFDMVERYVDPT